MKNLLFTSLLVLSVICSHAKKEQIKVGIGVSENENAKYAGIEAAMMAKNELKEEAKAVIVFASRSQVNEKLIEGITAIFPKNIIYGCEGYSPVTNFGNFHNQGHTIKSGVAILAIGGKADLTIAHAKTYNNWKTCGEQLAIQLEKKIKTKDQGKLLICFGDQHVGEPNTALVNGLYSKLPKNLPIVGAAAGNSDAKEIVAGQITNATNIALLLTGDFEVKVGCNGGGGDLLEKANKSFNQSFVDHEKNPIITFVFDCGGRRNDMHNQNILGTEHKLMKEIAGSIPFFGFYGGGEIGTDSKGTASKGVGYSIATATIFQ